MSTEYWFYLFAGLLTLNVMLLLVVLLKRNNVSLQLAQFKLEQAQQQAKQQQHLLEQLHQQRQQK